jgi:hypothetical protein
MYVKTKEIAGHKLFYLCLAGSGGTGDRAWKAVEYSVCLGGTLNLSAARWAEILRGSPDFRTVRFPDVLLVMEQYVSGHGLRPEILQGLREAAHGTWQQKARRAASSDRRGPEDMRTKALRLLGLEPGSSTDEIESAFRRAARRHHPDVGGDPEEFRAIVDARNFLLGRTEVTLRDIL